MQAKTQVTTVADKPPSSSQPETSSSQPETSTFLTNDLILFIFIGIGLYLIYKYQVKIFGKKFI